MNPGDVDAFVKAAFVKQRERMCLKHETVAGWMRISAPQLSAQLQPGGHISVTRLLLISTVNDDDARRFAKLLWGEIGEFLGVEDNDAIAAELKRLQGRFGWLIDRVQCRMARAELREVEQRRGAA